MTETSDVIGASCDGRVRAAYDDADGRRSFVIADVSRDDAWLSVPAGEELAVEAYR
jgi:hypothetical protein